MNAKHVTILSITISCIFLRAEAIGQDTVISSSITEIIDELRSENQLHLGNPVGYAAIPETNNKYFKLFTCLKSIATTSELLQLAKDSSNMIKLYSYLILVERSDSSVKHIFLQNIHNHSTVWVASGCTGILLQVNHFMLSRIQPGLPESMKLLTAKEYKHYRKLVGLKH